MPFWDSASVGGTPHLENQEGDAGSLAGQSPAAPVPTYSARTDPQVLLHQQNISRNARAALFGQHEQPPSAQAGEQPGSSNVIFGGVVYPDKGQSPVIGRSIHSVPTNPTNTYRVEIPGSSSHQTYVEPVPPQPSFHQNEQDVSNAFIGSPAQFQPLELKNLAAAYGFMRKNLLGEGGSKEEEGLLWDSINATKPSLDVSLGNPYSNKLEPKEAHHLFMLQGTLQKLQKGANRVAGNIDIEMRRGGTTPMLSDIKSSGDGDGDYHQLAENISFVAEGTSRKIGKLLVMNQFDPTGMPLLVKEMLENLINGDAANMPSYLGYDDSCSHLRYIREQATRLSAQDGEMFQGHRDLLKKIIHGVNASLANKGKLEDEKNERLLQTAQLGEIPLPSRVEDETLSSFERLVIQYSSQMSVSRHVRQAWQDAEKGQVSERRQLDQALAFNRSTYRQMEIDLDGYVQHGWPVPEGLTQSMQEFGAAITGIEDRLRVLDNALHAIWPPEDKKAFENIQSLHMKGLDALIHLYAARDDKFTLPPLNYGRSEQREGFVELREKYSQDKRNHESNNRAYLSQAISILRNYREPGSGSSKVEAMRQKYNEIRAMHQKLDRIVLLLNNALDTIA